MACGTSLNAIAQPLGLGDGEGEGFGDGEGLGDGDGDGDGDGVADETATHPENSEVLLLGSIAEAVTNCP